MKKITFILLFSLVALVANAQYNSLEQKSALRTVLDIEDKLLADNSDTTAARLINEHKQAKKAMMSRLMKADGYSKIKKDKPSIDKFRAKTTKNDKRFAVLDTKEKEAEKAKQDYISSINQAYKEALPVAYP